MGGIVMEEIKTLLFELCLEFINKRIYTAGEALSQAREASNDDTKSSAGDKFETTREMMQQDISRNESLLMDAKQNLQLLNSVKGIAAGDRVKNGSLVHTNQGKFYISISAGQLSVGKEVFFAISAASPIGQLLMGKKAGDSFTFNGKSYLLESIG